MSVRAKFKVSEIRDDKDAQGAVTCRHVTLRAVYSPDPESPNYSWSKYTPSGELRMSITNPAAFEQFSEGQEFYIDLTPAEAAAPVG